MNHMLQLGRRLVLGGAAAVFCGATLGGQSGLGHKPSEANFFIETPAGLRAAVAEGLTIFTHRVNEAWFRDAARRRHTIEPDTLGA